MPHTFPATDSLTCLVGRTPWFAADAPVGLLTPCKVLISLFRQRDGGVPRGPGGPPHHFRRIGSSGKKYAALDSQPAASRLLGTLFGARPASVPMSRDAAGKSAGATPDPPSGSQRWHFPDSRGWQSETRGAMVLFGPRQNSLTAAPQVSAHRRHGHSLWRARFMQIGRASCRERV